MADREKDDEDGRPLRGQERCTIEQMRREVKSKVCKVVIFVISVNVLIVVLIAGSYGFSGGNKVELQLDVNNLKDSIDQVKQNFYSSIHSTYEILGNDECPKVPGTSSVYSGYVVGFERSEFEGTGSTTYRCLPKDEENIHYYNDTFSRVPNFQVNSEIRYAKMTQYSTFRPNKNSIFATCALCSVECRVNIQMIPANNSCPEYWALEYQGYLMTDHFATTLVCVDIELDGYKVKEKYEATANGTNPTLNHVLPNFKIYHNSEYRDSYVLSCAVCSK